MNGDSGKTRKVFTFTPESVFTINQNRCSRCTRISVHVRPEYAIAAIRQKVNYKDEGLRWAKNEGIDIGKLIDDFASKHEPIAHYFFSGSGIKLQNIDSMMAEHVVNACTASGTAVLVIHDSFIGQFFIKEYLEDLMIEAARHAMQELGLDTTGLMPKIKIGRIGDRKFDDIFKSREECWDTQRLITREEDADYVDGYEEHKDTDWNNDYYKDDEIEDD